MNRTSLPKLALVVILLVSAILRLWNLDATEFKYDEARVCNLAAGFVDTGIPPVRGMGSSAGIDNPPLAIYLMTVPVLLSRSPWVATAFVAVLNVVGVWACYRLGKRYWGVGVGLGAAFLLAISPWAVFYSRKVWAQDLLLPFVILFIAWLIAWSAEGQRWALSGALVSLAALTQIHMATVSFAALFALAVLLTLVVCPPRRRVSFWGMPLLVGIAASALLYAPYVVFDALTGWKNVRGFAAMLGTPTQTYWEAVRYALLNIGGREIHALAGPAQFRAFLDTILNLNYWPDRIEEALALASMLYLLVRTWRRRSNRRTLLRDGLLVLWIIVPVLFFLRSRSPVYPHYLIPLYPAPYLVLAIAATDLFAAAGRRARIRRPVYAIGSLLGLALMAWQVYLSLSIHAFVETHHTPSGMGTPIGILQRVSDRIRSHADAWGNHEVVVLCAGDNPATDECPAVLQFMAGRELALRFVDHGASLLLPESDADTLIVLAPGASIAVEETPRHTEPMPDQMIWLRENVDAYRFYRLPAGTTPLPAIQPDGVPVRLENGVSLLGYERSAPPTPGATTRLTLYWRVDAVPDSPPPQGYSFANHLLGADGQRYGQQDGPGYPVWQWRNGDTVLSWFEIPVASSAPDRPFHLRVGMYTYIPPDQFIAAYVVDSAGQRTADAVEWPVE